MWLSGNAQGTFESTPDVLLSFLKQPEAGVLVGNFDFGGGKRLCTGSEGRAVLSRAARRASRRKERNGLAVKKDLLVKGVSS